MKTLNLNLFHPDLIRGSLETGDIALFTSKWKAEGLMPDGSKFSNENVATSVFRKSIDEQWRLVIDNSFGPEILNEKKT